ncbi:MAG: glucose-1-phosphate thymidylyltransferase [Bacteroidetes bacterium B1(2017)]|nr:MAG: glucose-1-phosphate thymidylyltransferase [Bacteroidetes bacterium B1(2017)]
MHYLFFDPEITRQNLLPFTFTRPVANLRTGILTIDQKWQKHLGEGIYGYKTQDYLQEKFQLNGGSHNILINGSICPTPQLVKEIKHLSKNKEALIYKGQLLAVFLDEAYLSSFSEDISLYQCIETLEENFIQINFCYDIFSKNGEAIESDFELLTAGRTSQPIPEGNQVLNPERIFIEEGAKVLFSILNASTGSIYIGKNSEVMEGCKVRGPFALCEDAGLKMDAKIYGPTTVGPHCKVGGEVNNAVFYAYSNKGHDGFVGNAVIGEWVNMGADTNNSNLKNTYDEVKLWSYRTNKFEKTGLTFCGLMLADHAKCGINTMFNTGTVVGVGANIFGSGFPRNFVPSFSWGGAQGFETFVLSKFYKTAEAVYKRRSVPFTEIDKAILKEVFEQSKPYRFWEQNAS